MLKLLRMCFSGATSQLSSTLRQLHMLVRCPNNMLQIPSGYVLLHIWLVLLPGASLEVYAIELGNHSLPESVEPVTAT